MGLLPIALTLLFYSLIFRKLYNSRVKSLGNQNESTRISKLLSISKGLFGSSILFLISSLPMTLLYLLDPEERQPHSYYMYAMTASRLSSSFNPLLYGLSNDIMAKGYKNVFKLAKKKFIYKKVTTISFLK